MLRYERGRNYFIGQVKAKVMKQTQGVYPAPLRIIDVSYFFIVLLKIFRLYTISLIKYSKQGILLQFVDVLERIYSRLLIVRRLGVRPRVSLPLSWYWL